MTSLPTFRVSELYTHEEIYRTLSVGNAGGIRPSLGEDGSVRRLVLMTSEPSARVLRENPYHDRVEGNVLVYTAAGREGGQEFVGANRRLLDQDRELFPIYSFSNIGHRRDAKLGPKRWKFLGLLQYLRHSSESQLDARSEMRDALVFELLIHSTPSEVAPAHDRNIYTALYRDLSISAGDDEADRAVVVTTAAPVPLTQPLDPMLGERIRRSLLAVAPERFEHIVKEALVATGFEQVAVTRFSADGGIDVNATAGPTLWPYRSSQLQVQAKRWLHTVGRREVAELRGSLQPYAQGAVVTTSFFSKAAVTEATELTKKPIVLVNGLEFAAILFRLGQTDLSAR